ncbi:MAG: protein-disulfide reductase DsbD [Campylobacteraceae bacterium]|nr:protein-disulfide reductase DsbD [Campylobacteraceae bacterium]
MRFLWIVVLFCVTLNSQILTSEEAFSVDAIKGEDGVEVFLKAGNDIFFYEQEIGISLKSPRRVLLNPFLDLPEPEKYDNEYVYFDTLSVMVPWSVLIAERVEKNDPFVLEIAWQGCSKKGLCYRPMKKEFSFNGGSLASTASADEEKRSLEPLSEHDTIASTLFGKNIIFIVLSFLGFGLLLSLTPCIFPMIPILSSIIVSQGGKKLGAKRGFWLALVYVLAMSVAYTAAGVFAGLFGANVQVMLQTPWVIWLFSAIFVVLSFSMFGLYELQLPNFLRQKLAPVDTKRSSGIWGVAVMGFLSALIVGPCVAAPLAGALLYIGQSGDAFLGGVALFAMSLGMGVPLLLIGASAGKILPKPGPWMDGTKAFFGIMLLALAIWMLERVISSSVVVMLYGILAIGTAVFMGALEPSRTKGWWRLWKSIAVLILIYGIFLFAGGVAKATNPLNPLVPFSQGVSAQKNSELNFEYIKSIAELEERINKSTKPVMVDFYADWCVNCKELESITFADPIVKAKLEKMTLLKIDVTKNEEEDKALLKKFNLFGPPGLIFYKDGKELRSLQIVGLIKPKEFKIHLDKVFL